MSRSGVAGRAPLRALGGLGAIILVLLGVVTPASGTTTAVPVPPPLAVRLPQQLVGCDPVGRSVPSSTQQVLSLVLPTAYVASSKGTVEQADSFLVQAEVQNLTPLVVDYQIKPTAHWGNGDPIRRRDFVASWHDGASGTGPAAAQYRMIASITSPKDPLDVVVRFKEPLNSWQTLFSPLIPASVSQQALRTCVTPRATVDLSAGPYVILQGSSSQLTLVRNPTWWGTQGSFDPVTVTASTTIDAQDFPHTGPFGYAQLNWLSADSLSAITSSPASSSKLDYSNRLVFLDFATRKATAVPIALRRGLASLIDRTTLVDHAVGNSDGAVTPATSFLYSEGQPNYPTDAQIPKALTSPTTTLGPVSTDANAAPEPLVAPAPVVAQASYALMGRAGYHRVKGHWLDGSGHQLSVTLAVPTDDRWAITAAKNVAAQLTTAGVSVKVIDAPGSFQTAEMLRSGQVQLGIVVRTTGPLTAQSASAFSLSPGPPPSNVWAGFETTGTDQLAASASENMNGSTAALSYGQLDKALWGEMPSLPLFTEPYLLAWSSDVAGVTSNPYPPGSLASLPTWQVADSGS